MFLFLFLFLSAITMLIFQIKRIILIKNGLTKSLLFFFFFCKRQKFGSVRQR